MRYFQQGQKKKKKTRKKLKKIMKAMSPFSLPSPWHSFATAVAQYDNLCR
jgi:hypothetical protein